MEGKIAHITSVSARCVCEINTTSSIKMKDNDRLWLATKSKGLSTPEQAHPRAVKYAPPPQIKPRHFPASRSDYSSDVIFIPGYPLPVASV